VGRLLQRLAVVLVFAGVFLAITLAPSMARAALLPTCEHDAVTRIPVEWLPVAPSMVPPVADTCTLPPVAPVPPPGSGAAAEEQGDSRVPAMCDARGASAIAPQRVLPISDARIEAAPGCGSDPSAPVVGPGPRHSPSAGAAPALADHAVLDGASLVPPAASELAPPYPPITGGPRVAHPPGIDHPPR
jgi:hypothetical protein